MKYLVEENKNLYCVSESIIRNPSINANNNTKTKIGAKLEQQLKFTQRVFAMRMKRRVPRSTLG